MKRINLLDESTSNKIAAGEVVERPSSVVKELIENSIDAGSKNITIEIIEGGSTLIRIIDDGLGIHPDDIKKAFMPHATSKIKNSEDIFSINTLGFRGEALPSIASVSRINIKSRIESESFGRELIIEAGEIKDFTECGINRGTTIEVRDLFYNVPARKKFLKSVSREAALINDIVNRTALANPSISFKLYNNNKKVLHTFGTGNLQDVLRTIYGKSISDNVLYFEQSQDVMTIYGYIGKEEIARGSRNNQSLFVNGRYIKHKTINAAVENAFKAFSTVNKFPFFTLFVEIYPDLVDVNIHPTKAEIKFRDDRFVFKQVFDIIHNTLKENVFNSFSLPEEKDDTKIEYTSFEEVEEIKLDIQDKLPDRVSIQSFEKRERAEVKLPLDLKSDSFEYKSPIIMEDNIKEDSSHIQTKEALTYKEEVTLPKEPLKDKRDAKFPALKIIGQFNKTYIIGEYDEVLYLIDQHAAHEKILFEKYLKNIEEESLIVQPLLIPAIVDLSIDDYIVYEENKDVFKALGFTLEEFGGNTISLKEVPYFLGKLEAKTLLLNVIDNLKDLGSGKPTEVKYNKIATMACKAAVKGNDSLSEIEMVKLVEELRFINDPFHCPHGRPTIIKFTNYDLEKRFRRIV